MSRGYWKRVLPPEEYASEVEEREALLQTIKVRKIPHIELINELEKRGMQTTRSELSNALHGGRRGPKIETMLKMVREILEDMEHESS